MCIRDSYSNGKSGMDSSVWLSIHQYDGNRCHVTIWIESRSYRRRISALDVGKTHKRRYLMRRGQYSFIRLCRLVEWRRQRDITWPLMHSERTTTKQEKTTSLTTREAARYIISVTSVCLSVCLSQACRGYGYPWICPWIHPWIYPCVGIRLGSCCGSSVTKCTYLQVVGLRLESNLVFVLILPWKCNVWQPKHITLPFWPLWSTSGKRKRLRMDRKIHYSGAHLLLCCFEPDRVNPNEASIRRTPAG